MHREVPLGYLKKTLVDPWTHYTNRTMCRSLKYISQSDNNSFAFNTKPQQKDTQFCGGFIKRLFGGRKSCNNVGLGGICYLLWRPVSLFQRNLVFIFVRWPKQGCRHIGLLFWLWHVITRQPSFYGLSNFCVQEKFETTCNSERAVIWGFIPADFYTQKWVLVPCTLPVFIIKDIMLHNI